MYIPLFLPLMKRTMVFHVEFPDLECCEADGPDLEDAVENARDAARNWITAELEDTCEIPPSTHVDDIELKEGMFIRISWSLSSCCLITTDVLKNP